MQDYSTRKNKAKIYDTIFSHDLPFPRKSWKSEKTENLTSNALTATPKSHVPHRTPREYFYYSKHIMAK